MRQILILFLLVTSGLLLTSCGATRDYQLPRKTQQAVHAAQEQGFHLRRYRTASFIMTAYEHLASDDSNIHIYIEGDGNSWRSRYQLSTNPTPKQPLALRLAMADSHPNVVYIARPCQYTPLKIDPSCEDKFWSSHRYAEEVIEATNQVLDQLPSKNKKTNFTLIGFSGGASVAMLVAARRQDVVGVITVAGDLNHKVLGEHHNTTPLTGSLNPIDVIPKMKHVPQAHWCGSKDTVVPCWTIAKFCTEAANPSQIKCHTLKKASHHKGWEKAWPQIVNSL